MKWISVKDRLPENNKIVVVWDGSYLGLYKFIDTNHDARLRARKKIYPVKMEWVSNGCCSHIEDISHWTPLPQLPEKELE